jgi:hypothetical protein
MSNTNTGGPAYPAPVTKPLENYYPGLTMRDYFAAKAMQGWLATYPNDMAVQDVSPTNIADFAYEMADAMLRAREAA